MVLKYLFENKNEKFLREDLHLSSIKYNIVTLGKENVVRSREYLFQGLYHFTFDKE